MKTLRNSTLPLRAYNQTNKVKHSTTLIYLKLRFCQVEIKKTTKTKNKKLNFNVKCEIQ